MNPAAEQNFRNVTVTYPVKIQSGDQCYFADLNPDRVDFVTPEGVEVWLERPASGTKGGQKTAFVDCDGNRVGPIHDNLYPAIVYAFYHGWRDPSAPDSFNAAAIAEVRANTTFPKKGKATLRVMGEVETVAVEL